MTVFYTSEEVARILNLSDGELRLCLRAALFPPLSKRRRLRFSFQDLLLLKTTRALCASKIPVARIRRILELLKHQLPADRLLCNLKIYADGRRVVVSDGSSRWQPDSGQFVFNFEAESSTTQAIRPRQTRGKTPTRTAHDWMAIGVDLLQTSLEEAGEAFQEAVVLDPQLAEAHVNLGYVHQELSEFHKAQECYRTAIACAPSEVIGYFYLAVLLEEYGDWPGAMEAYRKVVELEPSSAEAHYHLAKLCEAEGEPTDAIRHFAAAKRILERRDAPKRPPHRPRRRQ